MGGLGGGSGSGSDPIGSRRIYAKTAKTLGKPWFYSISVKTANTLGKRRRETTQNIQPLTDTASCVLGAVHSKKTKVEGSWQSLVQTFQVSDGVDTLRRLLTDLEGAVDKISKPVYTTDDKESLYDDLANTLMVYHELEDKSGLTSNMKLMLKSIELQSTAGTEKLRELFFQDGKCVDQASKWDKRCFSIGYPPRG